MKKIKIIMLVCLPLLFFVACNSDSEFDKTMYEYHKIYVDLTNGMTEKYDSGNYIIKEIIVDFYGEEVDEKIKKLVTIVNKLNVLSDSAKTQQISEKYKKNIDNLEFIKNCSKKGGEINDDDWDKLFLLCGEVSMNNGSYNESLKALHLLDETD